MSKPRRVAPLAHLEGQARAPVPKARRAGPRLSSLPSALVVEADPGVAARLALVLEGADHLVVRAGTLRSARSAIASGQRFSIVVVGYALPDGEGVALLPDIHARLPGARVVVTAAGLPDLPAGVDLLPRPFCDDRAKAALGLRRPDC